jgi:hypothetical protein
MFRAAGAFCDEGVLRNIMRGNRRFIWVTRLALAIASSICSVSTLAAQPQTAEPRLEAVLLPGMTAWITDFTGLEEKTRIARVSPDLVTTTVGDRVRELNTSDVTRVRVRRPDSLLNGALIGAGSAVASGLFLCHLTEPWENCRDDVGPMLRIGAVGAAIGAGIDALIRGRKTIYEAGRPAARIQAAPIVGRRALGVQMYVVF